MENPIVPIRFRNQFDRCTRAPVLVRYPTGIDKHQAESVKGSKKIQTNFYPKLDSCRTLNQGDKSMASFKSILSDIGNGLKKFFTAVVDVATVAEPFVDTVFPGVATLFNTTLSAVASAEAASIAAGTQSTSGSQKLALVVASIESSFNAYLLSIGVKTPATVSQIEAYVNGVVASLNAIPSA